MLFAASTATLLQRLVTGWQIGAPAYVALAVLVLASAAYLAAVRRLHRFERSWPQWRTASFLAGAATLELVLGSGLASDARVSFTAHVVQMLVLVDLAPTLLALGCPLSLLLEASPRRIRSVVQRGLWSRAGSLLTHPLVALALVIASLYGYFATPLYRIASEHPLARTACEVVFVAVGCLYWWVAISPDRAPHRLSEPARLLLLGVTIPPGSLLGIELLDRLRPLSPGITLQDTKLGGAIVWGVADLYALAALGLVYLRWMRDEDVQEKTELETAPDPVAIAEEIVAAAARQLTPPAESR